MQAKLNCLLVLFLLLTAARSSIAQCTSSDTTASLQWTTQWCDEFNGPAGSAIDKSNWKFDTGNSGFGNNELETYCDPSSDAAPCSSKSPNAFVDGQGHLAIQVRSTAPNTWTSARLKGEGLRTFNAGRIEARIQFPSHSGLWPAFWLLGSQPGVSWPLIGESDIMENWPKTSKNAGPGASGNCSTVHTARTQGVGQGKCFTFPAGQQVDTGFHTYGQIWSANMIQYYIDDPAHPFFVITASDLPAGDTWPFSNPDNPFFVILNIAVGGTLGEPTDTKTGSQAPMLVDYVRQYVPSAVPSPQLTAPKDIALQAGGTHGNVELDLRGKLGTGRVAFSCTTDAPRASCVVSSSDPFNNHTVDFDHSTTAKATVTVKTGGNTQEGNRADGTPPGTYTVTVNAYTVSSTDTNKPSATATLRLTVK